MALLNKMNRHFHCSLFVNVMSLLTIFTLLTIGSPPSIECLQGHSLLQWRSFIFRIIHMAYNPTQTPHTARISLHQDIKILLWILFKFYYYINFVSWKTIYLNYFFQSVYSYVTQESSMVNKTTKIHFLCKCICTFVYFPFFRCNNTLGIFIFCTCRA